MMRFVVMLGLTLLAAGCSSRMTPPLKSAQGSCLGLADNLKTLHEGDELPRVIQVLGMPSRGYRAYSPFGRSYDVLEYDVTPTPCLRAVVHIDDKLQVIFDGQGRYVGHGDKTFMRFRRATTVRIEPLVVDPVILRP